MQVFVDVTLGDRSSFLHILDRVGRHRHPESERTVHGSNAGVDLVADVCSS